MPLIRYQVGDVVVSSDRMCACSRGLPLIERVIGREADYVLTPAGVLISGISLTDHFATEIRSAAQVQIVQETLTFLRLRLVAGEGFGPQSHREIESLVQKTFGSEMHCEVEVVDAIQPEPSGKFRFCISAGRDGLPEIAGPVSVFSPFPLRGRGQGVKLTTPAVSVVIATRNYGRYLTGALASVLNQTWSDLEIVVVDDGSADDTPAIVQPFLADKRIHYQRTDGLGQSRAKNVGIQLSHAPLIAFLDGDDEWLPDKLQRQLPLFCDPKVGVVYSRRTLMDEAGHELATPQAALVRGRLYDTLLDAEPGLFLIGNCSAQRLRDGRYVRSELATCHRLRSLAPRIAALRVRSCR